MLKTALLVLIMVCPLSAQVDPLMVGITTKAQVIKFFGQPDPVPYHPGTIKWSVTRPDEHGMNMPGWLSLTFDADGVLTQKTPYGIPLIPYVKPDWAPTPATPWQGQGGGSSFHFANGEQKLNLDGFEFKKPWLGHPHLVFTVNNETGHILDALTIEGGFLTKAGEALAGKFTFIISAVTGRSHVWTITLPAWVDDLKGAEQVNLRITSFRTRMNEAEAAAELGLAEKEKIARDIKAETARLEREKAAEAERVLQTERDRIAALAAAKQEAKDKAKAKVAAIAAQKKREDAIAQHPKEHQELIRKRRVCIGMSKDAVILAWGRPQSINRTVGAWGTHEQWVYGSGSYLYFENGSMTSFQD